MVEQVTFQTLFQFLQTVGILVGVFYYIMTLRNTRKNQQMQLETRQAQLFMPIYETTRNPEFRKQMQEIWQQSWTDHNDFLDKYGPDTNPEAFAIRTAVCSYFEGIGVLVKRDLVDISMVNDLVATSIITTWEKLGLFFSTDKRKNPEPDSLQ